MFRTAAVLDTNVFVAGAFNEGSDSRKIVDAIRRGDLILVWSEATKEETLKVVNEIPPISDRDFAELFTEDGRYEGPTREDRFKQVPDPTDRKFAAVAEATGVAVVSSDSDLLESRRSTNITIDTPTEFVDRIGIF